MVSLEENSSVKRSQVGEKLKRTAPDLHSATIDVLTDMYTSDRLEGTESDQPIPLNMESRVSIEQGAMLNELMRSHSTKLSAEIGFAYGFSTIWMMDALRSRNGSFHTSIDPFQKINYGGIGLRQVERLPFDTRFQWRKALSILALTDLIREEAKFDFIFIDGNHRFDDVIVDFYLSDQILKAGGLLAFDDTWMPSVYSAINFVLKNRDYDIVPLPLTVHNMTVIKKKQDDNRHWTHFDNFRVGGKPLYKRLASRVVRDLKG